MKPILELPPPIDATAVSVLTAQLRLPEPIARILVNRGYDSPDSAEAYLRPRLAALHDPWAMPGMATAVERISAAINAGEMILVHGDYDVDGVCSSALAVRAIRELGGIAEAFVPHRLKDGYDFGPAGLAEAFKREAGVILTCDCGTTAHDPIAKARERGMDVVVTDHHTPPPELPPALAILNPHLPESEYPEKVLCGAGVVFKLLQALFESRDRSAEQLYKYLDLVAIPTIADLVPLTGENRVLARFGLKVLGKTRNPGLRALLRVAGISGDRPINAGQIAFVVGPRINAVGRMGDAMRGVRLLLTDDEIEARRLAEEVDSENKVRQEVDKATLDSAKQMLEETFDPGSDLAIVLGSDEWHPGVIGIVASRVVEEFYRPTILIALEGESGRGSGRSIRGFHLYDALKACESHLERFGGHRYAAGLEIRRQNIEPFRAALDAYAHNLLSPTDLSPSLRVDLELPISEVSGELWRFLSHFDPYGQGNPKPVFLAQDVRVAAAPQVVGGEHLRLRLDAGTGAIPDAFAFGLAHEADWLRESSRVDVAFHIRLREWQGVETLQAQLLDVRPSEAAWVASES